MSQSGSRLRTALAALVLALIAAAAFAQSAQPAQAPWIVTYQFFAPNAMGEKGREGIVTFMVRNQSGADAQNVTLSLPGGSALSLGPQNSVQVGDIKNGGFATFQARIVDPIGDSANTCRFQLTCLSGGQAKAIAVAAMELKEAGNE